LLGIHVAITARSADGGQGASPELPRAESGRGGSANGDADTEAAARAESVARHG